MRELYKNSGHDAFQWKDYIEPNESVLKGKTTSVYITYMRNASLL